MKIKFEDEKSFDRAIIQRSKDLGLDPLDYLAGIIGEDLKLSRKVLQVQTRVVGRHKK